MFTMPVPDLIVGCEDIEMVSATQQLYGVIFLRQCREEVLTHQLFIVF